MKYREVASRLRKLGCVEIVRAGGGSHRKWFNPVTGGATALPDWGGRDLKSGTLHGAVRHLGLDWQQFLSA